MQGYFQTNIPTMSDLHDDAAGPNNAQSDEGDAHEFEADRRSAPASEAELLKSVLEPLFGDFQHWFGRTITLLEDQQLSFLKPAEQTELLQDLTQALQSVNAAHALFLATDGQAGIDTAVIKDWHMLVTRCWQILIRARQKET